MSKSRCLIVLLLLFWGSAHSNAWHKTCDASTKNPCVVIDHEHNNSPLHFFRNALTIASSYKGNIIGVGDLLISGSEEPSEMGWLEIAHQLKQINQAKDKIIQVLDLREETHGYLNGQGITLASEYNWINLGKDDREIDQAETQWLKKLTAKKQIKGVLTVQQFDAKQYADAQTKTVEQITTEAYWVKQLGFKYHRFYISDHRAPRDSEVDKIVRFFKKNHSRAWFHVHCRGGKGRTTTIFAMYDMWLNADTVTFADIIQRQAAIAPFYNLFVVNRTIPELTPYYEQRISFLQDFYQFSRHVLAGYSGTWSEWKVLHTANFN